MRLRVCPSGSECVDSPNSVAALLVATTRVEPHVRPATVVVLVLTCSNEKDVENEGSCDKKFVETGKQLCMHTDKGSLGLSGNCINYIPMSLNCFFRLLSHNRLERCSLVPPSLRVKDGIRLTFLCRTN